MTPKTPIPAPPAGEYLCRILTVDALPDRWILTADIATGDYAGWATTTASTESKPWPINWTIYRAAATPIECLHHACKVQHVADAAGHLVALRLDDTHTVRRIYQPSRCPIRPKDILLPDTTWGLGTPTHIRATHIATLSGLPILIADACERKSPMVQWAADHGIAILPQSCMSGDYTLPGGHVVVDRKACINELWSNMCPGRRRSYEIAAERCKAMGQSLVYLVADNAVERLEDLAGWSYTFTGKDDLEHTHKGSDLLAWLRKYLAIHPNVQVRFCKPAQQCQMIWDILKGE